MVVYFHWKWQKSQLKLAQAKKTWLARVIEQSRLIAPASGTTESVSLNDVTSIWFLSFFPSLCSAFLRIDSLLRQVIFPVVYSIPSLSPVETEHLPLHNIMQVLRLDLIGSDLVMCPSLNQSQSPESCTAKLGPPDRQGSCTWSQEVKSGWWWFSKENSCPLIRRRGISAVQSQNLTFCLNAFLLRKSAVIQENTIS